MKQYPLSLASGIFYATQSWGFRSWCFNGTSGIKYLEILTTERAKMNYVQLFQLTLYYVDI